MRKNIIAVLILVVGVAVVVVSLRAAMLDTTLSTKDKLAAACMEKGWNLTWSTQTIGWSTYTSMTCEKP